MVWRGFRWPAFLGVQVRFANPVNLNLQAVYNDTTAQPNEFDSQTIEDEVRSSAAALGGSQPQDNAIPGESASGRKGYESARRGVSMTFPCHDVKVIDPAKLERMTGDYQAYRRGEFDRSMLPDIRDVLPDPPAARRDGFDDSAGAIGQRRARAGLSDLSQPAARPNAVARPLSR